MACRYIGNLCNYVEYLPNKLYIFGRGFYRRRYACSIRGDISIVKTEFTWALQILWGQAPPGSAAYGFYYAYNW